jgi:hypothetical protein
LNQAFWSDVVDMVLAGEVELLGPLKRRTWSLLSQKGDGVNIGFSTFSRLRELFTIFLIKFVTLKFFGLFLQMWDEALGVLAHLIL